MFLRTHCGPYIPAPYLFLDGASTNPSHRTLLPPLLRTPSLLLRRAPLSTLPAPAVAVNFNPYHIQEIMTESDPDKETTQLEVSAVSPPKDTTYTNEALQIACHGDDCNGRDGSTIDITESPWDPSWLFIVHESMDWKKMNEVLHQRFARMSKYFPNDIIVPDPTPKFVQNAFNGISQSLVPILEKDSVRCFLRLFAKSRRAMAWNLSITPDTLTCMVSHNALRCAKVVLQGKASGLHGLHANPNCMNPRGYFPIHEAAERFSVDMIKLLFCHGASANVRTVGNVAVQGLLPLHVAIENTCMHKYLEDNLSPTQYNRDYIYKLIHLLCLPEMKIFLDTVRLLAEKTDNLVDEIWNYITDRKLVQTSILLLAAQKHIRKHDWFNTIMYRIFRDCSLIRFEKGDNGQTRKQLEVTFHLVNIISHAGESLDEYIQAHSEVPHAEALEHVSSILKEFGFCPRGDCIDVTNLRPYDCKVFVRGHDKGHVDGIKEPTEIPCLHAAEKAVIKKTPGGWDPTYMRRSFLPYWRSVLVARCKDGIQHPSYADNKSDHLELLHSRMNHGPSLIRNHNIGLAGRIQQLTSTHQSRTYSTSALKTLAKVLRIA